MVVPRKKLEINTNQRSKNEGLWLFIWGLLLATSAGLWLFGSSSTLSSEREKTDIEALPDDRKEKLERALAKLEEAEQYALLAVQAGWYPCFNCPNTQTIYLIPGEVWKYGVTTNGPARYSSSFYRQNHLQYIVQFRGPLQECLREEKIKIYRYAILPENLKRNIPLIRPPGNKKDS